MTRIYEVNPANTAQIWDRDANGRVYGAGGRGPWRTNMGIEPSTIPPEGIPEWDLYPAIEDSSAPPQYYTLSRVDLAFEGAVNDPAARVRETRVFERIPLDSLYTTKMGELRAQDNAVRYQTYDTGLAQNWWVVCTQNARNELYEVAINWNLRQHKGQGWPGGINAPRIGVLNANTGQVRREQIVTAAPFEQLIAELALHGQDCGLATHDCGEAMEAAYNQADWDALAAIDPTDGSWGYPPYQPLSEQAIAQFNGQ